MGSIHERRFFMITGILLIGLVFSAAAEGNQKQAASDHFLPPSAGGVYNRTLL